MCFPPLCVISQQLVKVAEASTPQCSRSLSSGEDFTGKGIKHLNDLVYSSSSPQSVPDLWGERERHLIAQGIAAPAPSRGDPPRICGPAVPFIGDHTDRIGHE